MSVTSPDPPKGTRTRRRPSRWLVFALVLVILIEVPNPIEEAFWGLFSPRRIDRPMTRPRTSQPSQRLVLLISFDGLARTVLERRLPSTIADLAASGSVSIFANDLSDSTLESHGIMISSQPSDESGFDTHTYRPWTRFRGPTLFTLCEIYGLRCGLFVGKAKLVGLVAHEPGCERFERLGDGPNRSGGGANILEKALAYIRERDPDFVMLHLPDVDVQGHRYGWGSEEQLEALTRLDRSLGDFLVAAAMATPRHLAILITADHGGYGTSHRMGRPEVDQVPWILWGDGVSHELIAREGSSLDTAPTVARLLGVPAPPEWRGQNRVPVAPATSPSQ